MKRLLFMSLWAAWLFLPETGNAEMQWPTVVEECEVYREDSCQFLLCLCYVGCNTTPDTAFGIDKRRIRWCESNYVRCGQERQAQLENR